jgi:hypothetical protein
MRASSSAGFGPPAPVSMGDLTGSARRADRRGVEARGGAAYGTGPAYPGALVAVADGALCGSRFSFAQSLVRARPAWGLEGILVGLLPAAGAEPGDARALRRRGGCPPSTTTTATFGPPISFRKTPHIAFLRYCGTITTWYRQRHLTRDWLCHSSEIIGTLIPLAPQSGWLIAHD